MHSLDCTVGHCPPCLPSTLEQHERKANEHDFHSLDTHLARPSSRCIFAPHCIIGAYARHPLQKTFLASNVLQPSCRGNAWLLTFTCNMMLTWALTKNPVRALFGYPVPEYFLVLYLLSRVAYSANRYTLCDGEVTDVLSTLETEETITLTTHAGSPLHHDNLN